MVKHTHYRESIKSSLVAIDNDYGEFFIWRAAGLQVHVVLLLLSFLLFAAVIGWRS